MRFDSFLAKLVTIVVLVLGIASAPAAAVSVHGASHYGLDPGFSACDDPTASDPCQSFDLSNPTAVFSADLGYVVDIYQDGFVINDGNGGVSLYNLIDLGAPGPNVTFTLPASFAPPAQAEILGCGGESNPFDGSTFPTDSNDPPDQIGGICTPGSKAPDLTLNANGSFTTGANFSVTDLVLDAPVGAVSTPEPGTLFLLGVGLVAVGRKFRRAV